MPRASRDWAAARGKVELEGACRACGRGAPLDAAHVIGRTHDYSAPLDPEGWEPGVVVPERVIPLCRLCHDAQHAHRLDLLPLLDLSEQVQAVADAGGISRAYDYLARSDSPRRVRAPASLPLPGDLPPDNELGSIPLRKEDP